MGLFVTEAGINDMNNRDKNLGNLEDMYATLLKNKNFFKEKRATSLYDVQLGPLSKYIFFILNY